MPERFLEFAHPLEARRATYQFRSTWLASSLRALRKHGFFDAYRARLPQRYHGDVIESVAGVWLPIEVALAHYEAVDALAIPPATIVEMGREIQDHAQSILVQLALRTSRQVGTTPWVVLKQTRTYWDRTWRGGDLAIDKLGPKEAQIEIVEWSVAPSTYVRHAMIGVLGGVLGLFCSKAYVRDVPSKCRGLALGYRASWT